MKTTTRPSIGMAAFGLLVVAAGAVHASSALPAVHSVGQVEYMVGGIGRGEADAIEHVSKQWPLTIEFAEKSKPHDEFVADVQTTVRDANGKTVLHVDAAGPFLLAKLAPGRYTIDARLAGKTVQQKVDLARGQPAKAVLVWPAGADQTRS